MIVETGIRIIRSVGLSRFYAGIVCGELCCSKGGMMQHEVGDAIQRGQRRGVFGPDLRHPGEAKSRESGLTGGLYAAIIPLKIWAFNEGSVRGKGIFGTGKKRPDLDSVVPFNPATQVFSPTKRFRSLWHHG
jgi:hypothetical protein